MKVKNKKCIRNLSIKQFKAGKTRNLIAVFAIALTTLLFTSIFTIAFSINEGIQESNFRQCGGWSHTTFKYMTEEQFENIKDDPLIQQYGKRRFVGMPSKVPFNKSHVEVGYSDKNQAHFMYCDPVEGRLPKEGTNEAATDTKVLKLLGVKPKIGEKFTLTFDVDGKETTQTFTLSGYWEYDEAIVANHVLIPESRAESIFKELNVIPGKTGDAMTGSWNMDVMFKNSRNISKNVETVLENHGYQQENNSNDGTYISTGINWGYSGAQMSESMDYSLVIAIVLVLLLIIFTGYLIIYNVFQISVANDIRFYGLLKTIGTTPRQLKKIIRQQAMLLSLIGIPFGLLAGWIVGKSLTAVVMAQLDGLVSVVSISPGIFIFAVVFTLFTVWISCIRPGRIASKVSPIEAVRYTEGSNIKRKSKKTSKKISLWVMAKENLGRSKGKTIITVISLSLSVVLLNLTVIFTKGFDMDKYLSNFVSTDFVLANALYFNGDSSFSDEEEVSPSVIDEVSKQNGITDSCKIYGKTSHIQELVTEKAYRNNYNQYMSKEEIDNNIKLEEKTKDGRIADDAQIYGMEKFALDNLKVWEGDLSKVYEPGSRNIAAVYVEDDYGKLIKDSRWAKIGDKVTLRYVDEFEYYNPETGEVYPDGTNLEQVPLWRARAKKYKDVEYTVSAIVTVPTALSYRYYGHDEFILNDKTFIQDSGTDSIMLYAFNTTKKSNSDMETFLKDYTTRQNQEYDYESKEKYVSEFESMRSMFLLMGGALSFIVGLIGVLNFFNAILTSIITRKREFAMLQSVGMTGKQLKTMLVYEGLYYALGVGVLSLGLSIILNPFIGKTIENMFWFFTYKFTITSILIVMPMFILLGIVLPLVIYKFVSKATIVERLREN
ncbi:ABC transporter permease [Peptacetobacter hiranonis]|uniref:ABC transporter permease n=1 Tax=Peptacetobacter hiranonis TaxID=89152 RepID=UPI001916E0AC|nr:ABC transporter permease [Peptacetobacter hiranonis]QQQ86368.1 ABC transporter permease [Peptacetobacter hiranonis]